MQKRRRYRLALAVPAVVAAVALTACSSSGGSGSGSAASGGTDALQKIGTAPETTSLSMPATAVSAADGPLEFTVANGYFTKKGLSVTVPLSAEAQVKDAVATGSAALDDLGGSGVLDLYAKGEGVETIGCTAANNGFYVYAKKGVTTGSLSGTSVGVPSLDGSPPFNLKAAAAGFTDLGYAVGPPTPYVVNTSWAAKNGATITNWIEAFDQG